MESMTIKHLLFDMDNTLYPSTVAMDTGITKRMLGFVASWLNVSYEEAIKRRAKGLPKYGTTLEWLQKEEGLKDIEVYFRAVHPESEESELPEQEDLRPFLQSLNMPMSVLSNAPIEHVNRVLKKLNVIDLFDSITDIRACNLKGKPYESAYRTALKAAGADIENTLFFDDHPKYIKGYSAIGGTAVLVGKGSYTENYGADAARWMADISDDRQRGGAM